MDRKISDDNLQQYFRHHKKEIDDNGFSERVMNSLPQKKSSYYIIYLFLFAGIFFFQYFNGYDQVLMTFSDFIQSIMHIKLPSVQSICIVAGLIIIIASMLAIDQEEDGLITG